MHLFLSVSHYLKQTELHLGISGFTEKCGFTDVWGISGVLGVVSCSCDWTTNEEPGRMTNYTRLRENKCERKRGRVKGTEDLESPRLRGV